MKTLLKSKIITNMLWMAFGVLGVLIYSEKEEYWFLGLTAMIAVFYAIKLIKSIHNNAENTL